MPRTGPTYNLPAGNPVVTLTTISSSWANVTMSDIATALTGSLPINGAAAMTAPLQLADGTNSLPGLTFATETTSGIYRAGTNQIGVAIATVNVLKILGTQIQFLAGTATLPAISFLASPGTGIYTSGPSNFDIATNGTNRLNINIAGAVTIAAAAAGASLNVNGPGNLSTNPAISIGVSTASGYGIVLSDGTNTVAGIAFGAAHQIQIGSFSAFGLDLMVNSTVALTIANTRAITVNAPSAGNALTLSNTGAATTSAALKVNVTTAGGFGAVFSDGTNGVAGIAFGTSHEMQLGSFGAFGLQLVAGAAVGLSIDLTGLVVSIPTLTGTTLGPIYSGIPRNVQNANYQFVAADAAKLIYHSGGANTWTIPSNATVPFPPGTTINLMNLGTAVTLNITTDVLTFLPTGTTGPRTLGTNSLATLYKLDATDWTISGVGIT